MPVTAVLDGNSLLYWTTLFPYILSDLLPERNNREYFCTFSLFIGHNTLNRVTQIRVATQN